MKLAIIIPTYNNLEGLKKLIKSIKKHTKDYNLYVVEDGLRKATRKWLLKNEINAILQPENRGVAPSWNTGLVEALQDGCTHFAFMNDDIEVCEGWNEFPQANMVCLDAPSPIPLTGWFFVLDKECVDRVGFFDEQFVPFCGEDHDYWLRFKASGLKMAKVKLDVKHIGSNTLNKLESTYYKQVRQENWQRLRKKYPKLRLQM